MLLDKQKSTNQPNQTLIEFFEWGGPLLTMTIQVMSKQCWARWTWTTEFQDYHILLWSMRRVPALENWFRKLRTSQIDTLFEQDLRQNEANNPFSSESKKMIQEVGNIELSELLETDPKTQCKACLSYWNAGIVYCTCGHFLQKETEANRGFVKFSMDFLSLPEYVINVWRLHGHRYGKKPGDKEYFWLTNWRRNAKRKSSKESMIDSY